MRSALLALAASVLAAASPARAQSSGVHQHDGFFLQMNVGGGGLSSSASAGSASMDLSGGAGLFTLALGGVVAENLVIGGELWGASASSPTIKQNGEKVTTNGDTSYGLSAIGFNVTYYFMPINVYVMATPSFGTLTMTQNGSSGSTKRGFAIKAAVGKEWWVSDNWGLGVNVQYAHATNDDKGTIPATFRTNWFGVAFSATYN